MKIKLIQTTNYLLLIDEEAEIKEKDLLLLKRDTLLGNKNDIIQFLYDERQRATVLKANGKKHTFECSINFQRDLNYSKIIAYYPLIKEAKELDLSLLPNPFEGDIEKLAKEKALEGGPFSITVQNYEYFFKEGCKAAQPKQFSLEDMKKAMKYASELTNNKIKYMGDYIQSLTTQQLPKEFIPEYEEYFDQDSELGDDWGHKSIKKRLKTTTNSKGKGELVGEYRY